MGRGIGRGMGRGMGRGRGRVERKGPGRWERRMGKGTESGCGVCGCFAVHSQVGGQRGRDAKRKRVAQQAAQKGGGGGGEAVAGQKGGKIRKKLGGGCQVALRQPSGSRA